MELDPVGVPASPPEAPSFWRGLHMLLHHFSPSERLLLYCLSAILAGSAFVLLAQVNDAVSTRVPAAGGRFVEGSVGTPRFVNPILATTPIDQDLVMLTYSGLLRLAPDGSFIPDLASSFETSDDGATYTFHLREGLIFHDGEPLTAEDVLYTVALAQNPEIKSPRRADWEGITVETPDERTVIFKLPHAYAPFVENATLGILPKEHWQNIPAEEFPFHALNTHPVGSGPYEVRSVDLDATGAPEMYSLRSFKHFALGAPHITRITYRAYPNESALLKAAIDGDIDSYVPTSPKVAPRDIQDDEHFLRIPLTRMFGIFFNQNHAPVLLEAAVRSALNAAVDKDALVADILGGFGSPLASPIPASLTSAAPAQQNDRIEVARGILTRGGWTYHEATEGTAAYWKKGETTLSIALATTDTEELAESAERVASAWRELGVDVDVRVYPLAEFNQTILRPRSYDAILFGEVVGRTLDLYPFWHSSQRNDPGLNLSLYANAEVDRVLSEARATSDRAERERLIDTFIDRIEADVPAIFLYSPEMAYFAPQVEGIMIGALASPAERFAFIHSWYRDTERVWNMFSTEPNN